MAPVNGALLVAEELGFEQGVGKCAAVDLDERPGRAPRAQVDRARYQLLAGARFARDVHDHVRGRDLGDGLEKCEHERRPTDHFVRHVPGRGVGAQDLDLGLGALARKFLLAHLQRALDLEAQHLGREGFLQEIHGAETHGLDRGFDRTEGGDDQRRTGGIDALGSLDDFEAVHALHLQVGDEEVGRLLAHLRQSLGAAACHVRFVSHAPNRRGHALAHGLVVINDENASHGVRDAR